MLRFRVAYPRFFTAAALFLLVVFAFIQFQEEGNPSPSVAISQQKRKKVTTCGSTLVTAYYNISSKHPHQEYLKWMAHFLSLQDCMVVFISPELEHVVKALRPTGYPLHTISRPLNSLLVAQELDSKGWAAQEAMDPERSVGHSRELYWIWNEKAHMLRLAVELNLFQSTYFAWLDIGAIRHRKWNNMKMLKHLPAEEGMLLLQVGKFTQDEKQLVDGRSRAVFTKSDRIGGGMMGGSAVTILAWHSAYYSTLRRYLSEGLFIGKDQSVMAATCLENPQLCLLLDGTSTAWFSPPIYWFLLQNYFLGLLDQEPVMLNTTTAITSS